MSELMSVTCHMRLHSVIYHLTQVNIPHLNHSQRPVLDLMKGSDDLYE